MSFSLRISRFLCLESRNTECINKLNLRYTKLDFTKEAAYICQGVQQMGAREDVTLLHLGEILKGSMNAKIMEKNHNNLEMHAKMAKYKKVDIERFLRKLIFSGYLKVKQIFNKL